MGFLALNRLWHIGSGANIPVWKDNWIWSGTLSSFLQGPLNLLEEKPNLNQCIIGGKWNFNILSFSQSHSLLLFWIEFSASLAQTRIHQIRLSHHLWFKVCYPSFLLIKLLPLDQTCQTSTDYGKFKLLQNTPSSIHLPRDCHVAPGVWDELQLEP